MGDNGILEQAANAKETSDYASELESLTLAVNGTILMSSNYEVEANLLESELANYFETGSYSVSDYADSGVIVAIGTNAYIVSTNGNISEFDDDWYGDGTSDTYYISTAIQLCELSDIVNNENNYFEDKTIYLTNNIDMSVAYDAGVEFATIDHFSGTFDGNGYEISGFENPNIEPYKNTIISSFMNTLDGIIRNLGITNSTFKGSFAATFCDLTDGYDGETNYISGCWSENNVIEGDVAAARNLCG